MRVGRAGFTMLEVLLVLGIVAFLAVMAVPRLENTNSKMRREMRTLTVLLKRLHHLARLNRQTYRLVLDFPENDEHKMWVESSSKKVLFAPPPSEDDKDLTKEELAKLQAASGFQLDKSFMKEPSPLPSGIFFESLELAGHEDLITAGRAYIHFLPQGMAEECALVLGDKKELHWTIILNPLTGQTNIVDGKTTLKEAQGK